MENTGGMLFHNGHFWNIFALVQIVPSTQGDLGLCLITAQHQEAESVREGLPTGKWRSSLHVLCGASYIEM